MQIKDLREKRMRLVEGANAILSKAHAAGQEVLPPDEMQAWDRMVDEADGLLRHIQMLEKQELLAKSLEEPQARVTEPSAPRATQALRTYATDSREDAARALRLWLLAAPTSGYTLTADDRALCDRMGIPASAKQVELRLSTRAMRDGLERRTWEYRAQSVATPAAGGYTVPDETMRALEIALLDFGGMRRAATIIRTSSGADLPMPTVNDTANVGVILNENTQVANQDVAFSSLVLNSFKYSSKQVLVSVELLQDSAVPLGEILGRLLGERIGRITNTHFTVGTGVAMPLGIVPAATVGFTAPATDGQVTAWKYTSMVEMEHSIDPAYRRNASWMMSDNALKKSKLILDTQGRPLWAAGIAGGAPDTLLGYPLIINNDMAVMAANAKSVLFGDLSKYIIRDVLGITLLRLEERYADFHQVAFLAFARMDGDLLDAGTHPVKVFVNAAT